MTFIHHHQKVVPKEVDQRSWFVPRFPSGEMTTVVLNPAARPHLLH